MPRALAATCISVLPALAALASAAGAATVSVDAAVEHQTWFGFGATHTSEVFGTTDVLTPAQRAATLDFLYNQVRIRTGQVPNLFEAPQAAGPDFFSQQANDDANPFVLNWPGFSTHLMDTYRSKVVDLVDPQATADLYPSQNINTRWSSQWLEAIRQADYPRFLDECAEQVLAGITRFSQAYGREPDFDMLFNEPTSGNRELVGGNDTVIRDIVRRSGDRLRAAGFARVKFVVPAQETEDGSLATASFLCADPATRQYVGAISYHPYPYGSQYSYIPNILAHSGAGNPPADRIAVRNQLRELGRAHGIPVWMSEVSNGFAGDNTPANMESFDALRGRAIHIHDEIRYAEASAFFGMQSDWSKRANELHGLGSAYGSNPDDVVFTDQDQNRTFVTGMGRAIGHYARFAGKGAIVVESASDDPLVLATAFRDPASARFVLVAINNATQPRPLAVTLAGITLVGEVSGERSTAAATWQPVAPFPPDGGSSFSLALPARSVTSLAAPIAVAASAPEAEAPSLARLEPVRPNPASGPCVVRWMGASAAPVDLGVFDVTGRLVRTLAGGGERGEITWDLRDERGQPVASGAYFLRLGTGARPELRRLVVVR